MSKTNWITIKGKLKRGYHVASGPSKAYPEYGSIQKQKPYFKKLGLNLNRMFNGTLNINIAPYEFKLTKPEHRFKRVKWTELTNAEDFSFSRCKIRFQGREYKGWIYYPDPKTKKDHFQSMSTIEVLAPHIPGIKYKHKVEISLNSSEVEIYHVASPG